MLCISWRFTKKAPFRDFLFLAHHYDCLKMLFSLLLLHIAKVCQKCFKFYRYLALLYMFSSKAPIFPSISKLVAYHCRFVYCFEAKEFFPPGGTQQGKQLYPGF